MVTECYFHRLVKLFPDFHEICIIHMSNKADLLTKVRFVAVVVVVA
jgi:hypothetical protein